MGQYDGLKTANKVLESLKDDPAAQEIVLRALKDHQDAEICFTRTGDFQTGLTKMESALSAYSKIPQARELNAIASDLAKQAIRHVKKSL